MDVRDLTRPFAGAVTGRTTSLEPEIDITFLQARTEFIKAQESLWVEANKATANVDTVLPPPDTTWSKPPKAARPQH